MVADISMALTRHGETPCLKSFWPLGSMPHTLPPTISSVRYIGQATLSSGASIPATTVTAIIGHARQVIFPIAADDTWGGTRAVNGINRLIHPAETGKGCIKSAQKNIGR